MQKLTYYLYRLGGWIVPYTPPGLGYALCRVVATILYQLNTETRRTVHKNLQLIMGAGVSKREITHRGRLVYETILYNYFDLFRLPALTDEQVNQLVTVKGWENVEAALGENKGIIMTSAHLGNIETVLYAMLLRGLKITIPVERMSPPELFDYVSNLRMSKGLTLIPVDGPLLQLLRTLKKGGVAGLAGDRDITDSGQVFSFFGHPAHLPDGHIKLALKTQSPMVIGFSRRNADHTHTAYFLPPYHPSASGTAAERVRSGVEYVVSKLEEAIAQTPEQWTVTVSIWAEEQESTASNASPDTQK
jgi:lauroyl/myristoyl acyltransferase